MTFVLVALVLAIALTASAPLLRRPERWSIRHPAAALATWVVIFCGGCLAFVVATVAVVAAAIRGNRHTGQAWLAPTAVVILAWVTLIVVGAVIALLTSRWEVRARSTSATRSELLLLTACRTYRTQVVAGVEVRYVDTDRVLAMSTRVGGPQIVVSRALVESLDPAQLRAVIEHERAHLRWRHDLIASTACLAYDTMPWLPAGRSFRRSVHLLVELAADDVAARVCGPTACVGALDAMHRLGVAEGADLRAQRLLAINADTPAAGRLSGAARSYAAAKSSRSPASSSSPSPRRR
ncbi:M56 family metallopeptidase [Rudaeicoccus suwonensis]|uniref:Zn-dependent protease with chaperone function n=1 Tax=Rudaeicoccus suwonensis TaxID=657409 RepID=A0A561E839_9MICO|nr:M56 family metallopeptidase [Rudaeicoccus suwonensis]TWE11781.1 Zn-dependent protease with chaperone function [Rudaeicoccus suwonensis]